MFIVCTLQQVFQGLNHRTALSSPSVTFPLFFRGEEVQLSPKECLGSLIMLAISLPSDESLLVYVGRGDTSTVGLLRARIAVDILPSLKNRSNGER